jgi:hypothetical protein
VLYPRYSKSRQREPNAMVLLALFESKLRDAVNPAPPGSEF